MAEKKTVSIATDPVFMGELSEYLEVLANPLRLKIIKFLEPEPREMTAIAEYLGMTYQNTKKHLDRLVAIGLVQRAAGFGRETERGIAPVWKYSLADGGLENLTATLGVFSSVAAPLGYNEICDRIRSVRVTLGEVGGPAGPVLYVIGGTADGRSFLLKNNRIPVGREDPDHPSAANGEMIVLPDDYRAVTRVTKPHAVLVQSDGKWLIEDNASTGGTYLNSRRLEPLKQTVLSNGDVIDLSLGTNGARLLFITDA